MVVRLDSVGLWMDPALEIPGGVPGRGRDHSYGRIASDLERRERHERYLIIYSKIVACWSASRRDENKCAPRADRARGRGG
jgi:hypothetical protein